MRCPSGWRVFQRTPNQQTKSKATNLGGPIPKNNRTGGVSPPSKNSTFKILPRRVGWTFFFFGPPPPVAGRRPGRLGLRGDLGEPAGLLRGPRGAAQGHGWLGLDAENAGRDWSKEGVPTLNDSSCSILRRYGHTFPHPHHSFLG